MGLFFFDCVAFPLFCVVFFFDYFLSLFCGGVV